MYILGINPSHDATAAIIDGEGKIICAVGEERLSRYKFHDNFPYLAIEECLRIASLKPEDISGVGFSFRKYLYPDTPVMNELLTMRNGGAFDPSNEAPPFNQASMIRQLMKKNIKRMLGIHRTEESFRADSVEFTFEVYRNIINELGFQKAPFITYDHHLSHAASAFYTSNFEPEETLVITLDGSGDGACASVSIVKDGKLEIIHRISSEISPGAFYSEITKFYGFRRNRHEGKITGLAAFGDPGKLKAFAETCLDYDESEGKFVTRVPETSVIRRKFNTLRRVISKEMFNSLYAVKLRDYFTTEIADESREDVAAAAQAVLERSVVKFVKQFVVKTGKTKIALAGGIFANVKVNQRILEIPGVEAVFIHPSMGDGGTALGAAFLMHDELDRKNKLKPFEIDNVYFGPEFGEREIEAAIRKHGFEPVYKNDIEKEIAGLLAKKKIVARFNGRMEYGPRALGNRTILADPTDKSINDWLNKRLERTEFMPFAPVVLDSAAEDIFDNYERGEYPSRFMTITFDVKKEWQPRIAGVTHVDGTARPQVISKHQNPSYYRILEEYNRITGLPVCVNTSFNMHEEPIVCTPDEALRSFSRGHLDYLAIGNFLVRSGNGE